MEKINTKRRDENYINALRRELVELFEGEIDDAEINRIRKITDILAEFEPREPFSEEYLNNKIKKKVLALEPIEKSKSTKSIHVKLVRVLLVAVIIVISFSVASTTLFGRNIFEMFRLWDDEVVELKVASTMPDNTDDFTHFRSIQDLEESLNYSIMTPNYMPSKYQLKNIALNPATNSVYLVYESTSDNKIAQFVIRKINKGTDKLFAEKNDENPKIIKQKNIEYYVLANNNTVTIQWQDNTNSYNLSGYFDENDVEKIVKNIK